MLMQPATRPGRAENAEGNGKLGLICKRDNIYTSKALDMVANGTTRRDCFWMRALRAKIMVVAMC